MYRLWSRFAFAGVVLWSTAALGEETLTPGPVGTYQIAVTNSEDGDKVYKLDTRTGKLWECGQVVFALNPTVVGSGCLEVPHTFTPLPK